MKHVLKLAAAAALTFTFHSGEVAAQTSVSIGTTYGNFNLGSLGLNSQNVTFDYSTGGSSGFASTTVNTGTVDQDFDITRGSFNTINAPDPVPAVVDLGGILAAPLGRLDGAWSSSADASKRYAFAFAEAIRSQFTNLTAQNTKATPFFPEYPQVSTDGSKSFAGAAYAFAYSAISNGAGIGTATPGGSVFANIVLFSGLLSNPIIDIVEGVQFDSSNPADDPLIAFNSPEFGSTDISPTGMNGHYELFWVNQANSQEVPEIDGPVLAQVGFVLAGLYFVVIGRRRREDEVDMSQAA